MAPPVATSASQEPPGPHPSFIQVAKPFLFHQQIEEQLVAIGTNLAREDIYRLQGIQWIHEVRTAMQLPVRTYTTAVVYFHKFRLMHKDTEYQYIDAAAAALLCACKIEDTLKKSREILCAAHNLKVPGSEHLSSDDATFDGPSRNVIGLERLMFEASGFDFTGRYPHDRLIKYAKTKRLDIATVVTTSFLMLHDLYKTFAPLKQTAATMSLACVKLATLLLETQLDVDLELTKYQSSEGEVMETVLDLLDLYTHFQKSTLVGQQHPLDTFIALRIKLNQQMVDTGLPRYTNEVGPARNGFKNVKTPKTPITPASPADTRLHTRDMNSPATLSPHSADGPRGMGARGQDGTVRFMQDSEKAKQEKAVVAEFFKDEYEEYEVEVEEPIRPERGHQNNNNNHGHHHRNDRFHNKRTRR